jgi:putative lipase involved disintegration of autophagic bodies
MKAEAVEIVEAEKPDYITGHSLGGIIAKLVCTETGIPGASFASLGAIDPFSWSCSLVEHNLHHNVRSKLW